MAGEVTLSGATDEQLIGEILRRQGLAASIWNVEDALGAIRGDEDLEGKTDEELRPLALAFLMRIASGLQDVLGERGNDYLSDRWFDLRDKIAAEVGSSVAPRP